MVAATVNNLREYEMRKTIRTTALALGLATMFTAPSFAETYFPIIAKGFSHQFWQAVKAGAEEAAKANGVPYLPGVSNAADIMRGLDHGLDRFKFFPAEASGGLKALKALDAPFGQVRFCPTGGITEATAPHWLAEPAVLCVGGSWVVKPGAPDTAAIRAAAEAASGLRTG